MSFQSASKTRQVRNNPQPYSCFMVVAGLILAAF
jgi:hypothetical protein